MIAIVPFLLLSSFLSGLGEVFCKYASKTSGHDALWFAAGAAIAWGSLPFVWIHIYRTRSILEMVILYTPVHSFALGMVGVLLFGDVLTMRLAMGGVLSILAILVMS